MYRLHTYKMVDDGIFYNSKLVLLDRIRDYGENMWANGFINGFITGILVTTSAFSFSILIHRRAS